MTTTDAQIIMQRCNTIGSYSEEPHRLTRRYATPPMHQVNEQVTTWMREAGMSVQRDAIGNIIGCYAAAQPNAQTLLLGSHLDTVRDAGKYDGPLGVMVALACVQRLHNRQQRLPFAIELFGFADEEGLRYHTPYLGSQAVAGVLEPRHLQTKDTDGITLREAMRAFGGDPDALASCKRATDDLLGYCEVHIEQGPILEARNLPVGIVSAIIGQRRYTVTFTGEAGHAGTVPMSMRHDALGAASEFVLAVEAYARLQPHMVATVGQLAVEPGASNVISGKITLSLDVRHQHDTVLEQACRDLEVEAHEIGAKRGITVTWEFVQGHGAVPCTPRLVDKLSQAIKAQGYPTLELVSGAGHDAAIMTHLTDMAMLFIRCKGGISHNPLESVTVEDVAVAVDVLERFILSLA